MTLQPAKRAESSNYFSLGHRPRWDITDITWISHNVRASDDTNIERQPAYGITRGYPKSIQIKYFF